MGPMIPTTRRWRFALLLLLAAAPGLASAAPPAYRTELNVAVPMRDGVVLRADVLRPAGTGRFPTLVYRTPYGKDQAQETYATFRHAAERGYAVVIQDVRGRYASAGEFVPYRNEGRDGYDTIEWAAAQPWSDGRIGTFGLSYPGAVQWLAALESPPHLLAMVPAMTFSTPRNFFYSGGAFDLSWIPWIWNNIAPDVRKRKNLAGPRSGKAAREEWEQRGAAMASVLPLSALPDLKDVAPYYYEWLAHSPDDSWWDWAEVRGHYDRVKAAVLNVSGWHDETYGPEGAVTNYLGLREARRGEADPRTRLLIGPWTHGVASTERARAGDRSFGPAAAIDYDETVLRFLDRYVRDVKNGLDDEPPVRIFLMGSGRWREGGGWPLPEAKPEVLYLHGSGEGEGLTGQVPAPASTPTAFVSDPAHPVTDPYAGDGAHDYRELAGRDDVAVFDSAPLERDRPVAGFVETEIFLSADVPDADLWLKLMDVAPDGTAFNLMSPGLDVVRVSRAASSPLDGGQPVEVRLPHPITGNLFRKGHRIRVAVMGSFMPHFSRNLQTGEREESSARTRKGTIRIYHDAEHPSRIVLHVLRD